MAVGWRGAMAAALYGSNGFFVRDADGPADHFRTSANASPLFAGALLGLIRRVDEALGRPDPFDVVDVGAGGGELLTALHILLHNSRSRDLGLGVGERSLSSSIPAARRPRSRDGRRRGLADRVRLTGVEVRIRPPGLDRSIRWRRELPDAIVGMLVATEWLDNVPLDVAEVDDDGNVRRVLVDRATGEEMLGPVVDAADRFWLARWWPAMGRPGSQPQHEEHTRRAQPEEPAEPAQPDAWAEPAQPDPQAEPTQRDAQTEPAKPDAQAGPAQPEARTEPAQPEARTEPAQPEARAEPGQRDAQVGPAQPDAQAGPTQPDAQTAPAQPEARAEPTQPDATTAPAQPDVWDHGAQPGERAEIGWPRDVAWAEAVSRVRRGCALAVDYGHLRAGRPELGTLTGFRGGRQVLPVPDGSCDVTAHVAMDAVAGAAGTPYVLVRQREALKALGIDGGRPPIDLAHSDPAAYLRALSAAGASGELIDPAGLGGHWWLLHSIGIEPVLADAATQPPASAPTG